MVLEVNTIHMLNLTVALTIDVIEEDEYPSGNLLWHNAMITVNINWHDPTGSVSTVGDYSILSVYSKWFLKWRLLIEFLSD